MTFVVKDVLWDVMRELDLAEVTLFEEHGGRK